MSNDQDSKLWAGKAVAPGGMLPPGFVAAVHKRRKNHTVTKLELGQLRLHIQAQDSPRYNCISMASS